jgi:hypothetical protein
MNEPSARMDLRRRALKGPLIFLVALWLAIFLPAGSLAYWQGWVFWAHFAAWTVGATLPTPSPPDSCGLCKLLF